MKTFTKISDTEFEVIETKEVVTTTTVNLDQLENEKQQIISNKNEVVTNTDARVAEINQQIIELKAEGAKTRLEVENEI